MTMNRLTRLGLALPLFALVLGLSRFASPFPVGSYDSDAYTLTFDTTGTFLYQRGDSVMVQGKYVVQDSTVSLTDEKGVDACVGAGQNPGTYRWELVGSALRFHTVSDPCAARVGALVDQTWQPHRAP